MEKKKKFWQFRNQANSPDSVELLLYGDIANETWFGDEVTPRQFAEDLEALGKVSTITVRINSGGGDVFAAQAIGNQLEQNSAQVTARIDGICASAATIVACHCDKVEAAEDSTYMVHLPEVGMCGYLDEVELGRLQNALETIKENIINLYTRKTSMSRDDAKALIEATTWMTGQQAKEKGFVDALIQNEKATVVENRGGLLFVNSVGTGVAVNNAPEYLKSRLKDGAKNKTPENEPGDSGKGEDNTMQLSTKEDLLRECPKLVEQIEQEARDSAAQAAREESAKAERERMKAIDEVASLFPEELVNEAKYGEKTCTAQELAYRAAVAAKKKGTVFAAALERDSKASGAEAVQAQTPKDEGKETLEQIRAQAKKDAEAYNKMMEGKYE